MTAEVIPLALLYHPATTRPSRQFMVGQAVAMALDEFLTPATREYGIGYAARMCEEDVELGCCYGPTLIASVRRHFRKIEAQYAD